jgi:hypothetical protein
MNRFLFVFSILFVLTFFAQESFAQPCLTADPSQPEGIVPTTEDFPGGNPACAGGFRINSPSSGTYNLDLFGNQVTIVITESDCGPVFTWTVSGGVSMDKIYVKGGTDQNIYDYSGTNPRPTTDGYLHAPLNSSGKYAGLSHIDFCFSYKLDVSKTAVPEFKRTYEWEIEKECEGADTLTLALEQIFNYPFKWTASIVDSSDSDWKVEGIVKIKNNTPFSATITSISDVITGGINVSLSCGVTFPYVLASGDSLQCSYSQTLPDASARTNTATVTTSTSNVQGGTANANFDFTNAAFTAVDASISVDDDCHDPVVVNYSQSPYTYEYTCPVGPYDDSYCGENEYVNRVSFITADLELTGRDSCIVVVNINCEEGCTLTPGYWKTHSQRGPAPYDNTWALLGPDQENTIFFLSGVSYYTVLWTPPAGNSYYILAHAYIASALNQLNGASIPANVLTAFNSATTFFTNTTPAQAGALKGAAKNAIITLAGILDDYNNGITGPGHCSDDSYVNMSKQGNNGGNEEVSTQVQNVIPDAYSLNQNYPNPFNPMTTISFGIPEAAFVTLKVYDLLGNEIATLVNENVQAGTHQISFDASKIPSGVYLYKIQAGNFILTKKMILMK